MATPIEMGQFLMLGTKTGALHLRHGSEEGVLFFHLGSVVSAVGPGRLTGVESAMAMLRWEEGEFDFIPDAETTKRDISVGTENLFLETARIMDEAGAGFPESARFLDDMIDEPSVLDISALTDGGAQVPGQTPLLWVTEVPGRSLRQLGTGPLVGIHPDGERHRFGTEHWDAATWLGKAVGEVRYEGWLDRPLGRVYVSWTGDLLRILHPVSIGSLRRFAPEADHVLTRLGRGTPVVLHGTDDDRLSRLAAYVSVRALARVERVLHATSQPVVTFDEADDILHAVVTDPSGLNSVRAVLARWRPRIVVLDVDPDDDVLDLVRATRMAGIDAVLVSRAANAGAARRALGLGAADAVDWQYVPNDENEARPTPRG